MEFRKYPSIAASSRGIEAATRGVPSGAAWVACEKIHGANFIVASAGFAVRFGKRTRTDHPGGWLADGDNFFGYQALAPELEEAARRLETRLGPVLVYGELYGGRYGSRATGSPVQTGIHYSVERRFIAFDVVADGVTLTYGQAREAAEAAGFVWVPEVAYGTLDELMAMDIEGEPTRLPRMFGLPDLVGNEWEGVVLRAAGGAGGLIKRKTRRFSEVTATARPAPPTHGLEPHVERMLGTALSWVTRTRYDGMVGKLGPDCPARRLCGLLVKDALDDLCAEHEEFRELFGGLNGPDRRQLTQALGARAAEIHAGVQ